MVLDPKSEEHFHTLWKSTSFFIAIIMFFIAIIVGIILNNLLHLSLVKNLILFALLGALYLFFIVVLFEFNIFHRTRVIEKQIVQEVERPIVQEVIVDRPVVREVVVEKPVFHKVPEYIYVEKPKVKLNIPKYDYIGSQDTMTYHRRSCRFSKLIKKKYKVMNNSPAYFVRNRFKPCKSCIKR